MPAIRDRGESGAAAPRTVGSQRAAFAAQRAGERNPNIWTGDIEAMRALEAARRRERLQQQALNAALAAQRAGERTWFPGNSSAGGDNASGISSGSGASGENSGYQDYRQGEYETFVADLPGFIPLRNEDAWSEWMRAEKWGTDLSTQQSISAFIGLVTASGQVEASDSATLDALSALFQENFGETENSILQTLLGSGALTGLGVTQYTIDYLTGDFNVQLAENAQNQVLAVQGMIADEILRFIDQGLLPADAEAFAERALLDPSNMGILMALFHEGLENLSEEEQRAYDLYGMNINYWKDTVVPFYFRSQTEDLYAPDTTPYGDMLLFIMSFYPVLDQIAAAIDLARSLYEGDVLGTALSLSDFLPGPNLGAADNVFRAAGRNVPTNPQNAWRNLVSESYARQLGLPNTTVVPGPPHPSITFDQNGRAIIGGRRAQVSQEFLRTQGLPGIFTFSDPDLARRYPSGVYIDQHGFPDFTPYAETMVPIEMTGTTQDFQRANRAAGFLDENGEATISSQPSGYTWHHHQDGRTMLLIPTELNRNVTHSGGAAVARQIYQNTSRN